MSVPEPDAQAGDGITVTDAEGDTWAGVVTATGTTFNTRSEDRRAAEIAFDRHDDGHRMYLAVGEGRTDLFTFRARNPGRNANGQRAILRRDVEYTVEPVDTGFYPPGEAADHMRGLSGGDTLAFQMSSGEVRAITVDSVEATDDRVTVTPEGYGDRTLLDSAGHLSWGSADHGFDSVTGVTRWGVEERAELVSCDECRGWGQVEGKHRLDRVECPTCGGEGEVSG